MTIHATPTGRATGASSHRLTTLVAVEIAVASVALVGFGVGVIPAVALGVVFLVLAIVVIPSPGRPSVLQGVRVRRDFRRRKPQFPLGRHRELDPLREWLPDLVLSAAIDRHGRSVGVLADGENWTVVLGALSDDDVAPGGATQIPLDVLGDLRVLDEQNSGVVQALVLTVPAPATALLGEGSPAADSYRSLDPTGGIPAQIRTWIVLRLNPWQAARHLLERGGDDAAITRALLRWAERAEKTLADAGFAVRALDEEELRGAISLTLGSAIGASSDPESTNPESANPESANPESANPVEDSSRSAETWTSWTSDGVVHKAARVPRVTSTDARLSTLIRCCAVLPALFTVVSVTPTGDGLSCWVRVAAGSEPWAGYAMKSLAEAFDPSGLRLSRRDGEHLAGVLATVPLGRSGLHD